MKCPSCQFENRAGANFCNESGGTLEVSCPKSGNVNRPGSKFCDECGNDLTIPSEPSAKDLSFDERIA